MVKVNINGSTVEVPPGTSVMDAIFHANHDVPLFCSERHLSPVGACRMCLARVGSYRKGPSGEYLLDEAGAPRVFWQPKMAAACVTAVSDGMFVDTLSDEVKHAQSGMVELTLANHPLDCPTCDKGGACDLQDRSYEYGLVDKFYQPNSQELPMYTRFEFTRRHEDKHHALSDFVVLDRERCIHCKRCVRYFEEIPGDEVLDFIERGVHTFIGTDDKGLPSNFTGNITDICPVGALLDTTARFRARNWEFDTIETTSMDDAAGAGILVDARSGRLERIRAAERPQVNQIWISDAARFGHQWANEDRLTQPLVRKQGQLQSASWEEALAAIAEGLKKVDPAQIGIYLSGQSTLEEGLAALELAEALNTPHRDFAGRTAALASSFAPATFADLNKAGFALLLGDPTEEAPTLHPRLSEFSRGLTPPAALGHGTPFADLSIKERMPRLKGRLAQFATYPAPLFKWSGASGVHQPGQETALLGALLGQNPAPEGLEDAVAWTLGKLREHKGNLVLVLGAGVLNQPEAAQKAHTLAQQLGARVMALSPAANARGLESVGLVPGKNGAAWNQGGVKAAYYSYLPPAEVLAQTSFRILHLTHLTPLASQFADVVLPGQTFYEKRGSTVNLEGRVLELNPAGLSVGQADGSVAALAVLAQALGLKPAVRLVRQAHHILTDRFQLPRPGQLWPRAWSRNFRSVATGQPRQGSSPLYFRPSMWRQEQRVGLVAQHVQPVLEVHPSTAHSEGLSDGGRAQLETPYGNLTVTIRCSDSLPAGYLYAPAYGPWAGQQVGVRVLVPQEVQA